MESRDAIGAAAGKRAFIFFSFYLRQVVYDVFTNEEIFLDHAHIFFAPE